MNQDPSTLMTLVKTLGALGIVVALILVLSWVAKRYLRADVLMGKNQSAGIKILQSFYFEPKKKLMVVEVDHQRLLLGVSEQSISFLSQLPAESSKETRHAALS